MPERLASCWEYSCLQVMEHGATVKKLSAVEAAKEAAEGSVRASADAARNAEAALVRPIGYDYAWCLQCSLSGSSFLKVCHAMAAVAQ